MKMSDNPNYRTLSGFMGSPFSTCPRPLTYIDPVFIGIQVDTRGAVAVLGVVKLDSSPSPKGGNMYYQQRLGYITLGALFRQILRGDNIQNSHTERR